MLEKVETTQPPQSSVKPREERTRKKSSMTFPTRFNHFSHESLSTLAPSFLHYPSPNALRTFVPPGAFPQLGGVERTTEGSYT